SSIVISCPFNIYNIGKGVSGALGTGHLLILSTTSCEVVIFSRSVSTLSKNGPISQGTNFERNFFIFTSSCTLEYILLLYTLPSFMISPPKRNVSLGGSSSSSSYDFLRSYNLRFIADITDCFFNTVFACFANFSLAYKDVCLLILALYE